jgi:hypothetical protein
MSSSLTAILKINFSGTQRMLSIQEKALFLVYCQNVTYACNESYNSFKDYKFHCYCHFNNKEDVICGICDIPLNSYEYLVEHYRKKHSEITKSKKQKLMNLSVEVLPSHDPIELSFIEPINNNLNQDNELVDEFICNIIKIKEKYSVPDSVANNICESFVKIMSKALKSPNPESLFEKFLKYSKSTFLQEKYMNKISQIEKYTEIMAGGKCFHYISLLKTLETIINSKNNYRMILENKCRSS